MVLAHHSGGKMRCGRGVAHRRHVVRQPAAAAVADPPAQRSCVRAVQRIDHHRHGRGQARPPRQPCGVRQVRMHHFWPLAPKPSMKANPSPRVRKPLAHLQADEFHAGIAQFRGCGAAGAGKRHHAHPPAAPAQPFGQQHRLPFGAANAVQAGDHRTCSLGHVGSACSAGPGGNMRIDQFLIRLEGHVRIRIHPEAQSLCCSKSAARRRLRRRGRNRCATEPNPARKRRKAKSGSEKANSNPASARLNQKRSTEPSSDPVAASRAKQAAWGACSGSTIAYRNPRDMRGARTANAASEVAGMGTSIVELHWWELARRGGRCSRKNKA